jgi:hypothetical protein
VDGRRAAQPCEGAARAALPPASSTMIGGRTLGSGGRTCRSTRHLKNTCPPSKGRAFISARMRLPGKRKVPRRSPPDLHPEAGVWRAQSVAQVRAAPGLSENHKERAAPVAGSQIGAGGCPPCVSGRRPATLAAAFLVRWRRKDGRAGSAQGASLRQPVRPPSRHPGSVRHTLRHRRKPVAAPGFSHASFPPRRDLADVIVAGKPDAAETAPHRIIDLIGAGVRDITDG